MMQVKILIISGKKGSNSINKNLGVLCSRGCCRKVDEMKDANVNKITE